jgi:hypothetical protein
VSQGQPSVALFASWMAAIFKSDGEGGLLRFCIFREIVQGFQCVVIISVHSTSLRYIKEPLATFFCCKSAGTDQEPVETVPALTCFFAGRHYNMRYTRWFRVLVIFVQLHAGKRELQQSPKQRLLRSRCKRKQSSFFSGVYL